MYNTLYECNVLIADTYYPVAVVIITSTGQPV